MAESKEARDKGLVLTAFDKRLTENVIELKGHELIAVPLGHTDTDSTTCLYVPSVGPVVAGDAAYRGVHLYLAASNQQTRSDWIAALEFADQVANVRVIRRIWFNLPQEPSG